MDNNHMYTPKCEVDKIPYLNQHFDSLDSAFDFYENYGRLCGLDVRRHPKKNKHGIVTSKYFVCSRDGSSDYDKPEKG